MNLPEEILMDIFSRLPTKSIGKFRSLSKTWRNSLSTPQFIKSHLAREKTRQQYHIFFSPSCTTIHSLQTIKGSINTISRKLDLPGYWSEALGSCNGLVLLLTLKRGMFMVNPITLEQIQLPYSAPHETKRACITYGFGYDSLRDDYKVFGEGLGARLLEDTPMLISPPVHWLDHKRSQLGKGFVVIAFDLVDEALFKIPPPIGVSAKTVSPEALVVLGGCLCLMDSKINSQQTDVWIMKEYGIAESWTKFNVHGYDNLFFLRPLCFIRDEEEEGLLLAVEWVRLFVYNVKKGTSRELVVDGVVGRFEDKGTFMESLVSPAAVCGH